MTPFKALYDRYPPTLLCFTNGSSLNEEVNIHIRELNLILDELKKNLLRAQNRMKMYANTPIREVKFRVGDWVLLKL